MSTVRFADLLQPGDVIERHYWGLCKIEKVQSSGHRLTKLTWNPIQGRVVNPPGIDYVKNNTLMEVIR